MIAPVRYGILSPDGTPLTDVKVPWSAGIYCRVFQDDRGMNYLLGSDGVIFGGGKDSVSFQNKTKLKLGWNQVEDASFGISAPRTGTSPSNVIDAVYSSGGGTKWNYARDLLHGTEPSRYGANLASSGWVTCTSRQSRGFQPSLRQVNTNGSRRLLM
jgi:hypothetical protein